MVYPFPKVSKFTPSSKHQPRSWSKAEASRNILSMVVTLWTAQPLMSWLKAEALWNMEIIVLTPEVSHAPMFPLKAEAAQNM